jgi:Uma2 family endonuclease
MKAGGHGVSIATRRSDPTGRPDGPLYNGDRRTQAEFHRLYETAPDDARFELVGGVVYMASPLRRVHALYHADLSAALASYVRKTPGIELLDNATVILGEESEPQPDLLVRILSEFGGQSKENEDGYIEGAPELVAEIAHSTRAIDMHQKRTDYAQTGVKEYLVLCIAEPELHWFDFKSRRAVEPDAGGIHRSRVFPGLWIDTPALLGRRSSRLQQMTKRGIASPEHATFVKRLQMRHQRKS